MAIRISCDANTNIIAVTICQSIVMSRGSNPGTYDSLCCGKTFSNVLPPTSGKTNFLKYCTVAGPVRSGMVKQDSTFIRSNLSGLHDLGAHFQFIQADTDTLLVDELDDFLLYSAKSPQSMLGSSGSMGFSSSPLMVMVTEPRNPSEPTAVRVAVPAFKSFTL